MKDEDAPLSLTTYSPDGSLIAGVSEKTITIFDTKSGKHRFQLTGHTEAITAIDFSPDSIHLRAIASKRAVK